MPSQAQGRPEGVRRLHCLKVTLVTSRAALTAQTASWNVSNSGLDADMGLLLGRALIGLGTAGGLVAGLKASTQWFPRERLATVNGMVIMCGGLGAFAATWPAEFLLRVMDWRGLSALLAFAACAVALTIYHACRRSWRCSGSSGRVAPCIPPDPEHGIRLNRSYTACSSATVIPRAH